MHLLQKQKEKINGIDITYHARAQGGLTEIIPNKCKHSKAYVYASNNIALCLIFATKRKGEEVDFGVTFWGKTYIQEFYEGAFFDRFKNRECYLYKLNKNDFKMETEYIELVSDKPVKVIDCEYIPDVAEYLLNLEKQNKLKIYRYNTLTQKQKANGLEILKGRISKYVNFKELTDDELSNLTEREQLNYKITKERIDFCLKKFPELFEEQKQKNC